jgi:hypothetical protein
LPPLAFLRLSDDSIAVSALRFLVGAFAGTSVSSVSSLDSFESESSKFLALTTLAFLAAGAFSSSSLSLPSLLSDEDEEDDDELAFIFLVGADLPSSWSPSWRGLRLRRLSFQNNHCRTKNHPS